MGMTQAIVAMAKGPAPMKDSKAVTKGRPNTTKMFTMLFELRLLSALVTLNTFSSTEVVVVTSADAEVTAEACTLEISATMTAGLKVGLYST